MKSTTLITILFLQFFHFVGLSQKHTQNVTVAESYTIAPGDTGNKMYYCKFIATGSHVWWEDSSKGETYTGSIVKQLNQKYCIVKKDRIDSVTEDVKMFYDYLWECNWYVYRNPKGQEVMQNKYNYGVQDNASWTFQNAHHDYGRIDKIGPIWNLYDAHNTKKGYYDMIKNITYDSTNKEFGTNNLLPALLLMK